MTVTTRAGVALAAAPPFTVVPDAGAAGVTGAAGTTGLASVFARAFRAFFFVAAAPWAMAFGMSNQRLSAGYVSATEAG